MFLWNSGALNVVFAVPWIIILEMFTGADDCTDCNSSLGLYDSPFARALFYSCEASENDRVQAGASVDTCG